MLRQMTVYAVVLVGLGTRVMRAQAPQPGPVAYNLPNAFGQLDLYLINLNGTQNMRVPVTPQPLLTAEFPKWSPDGRLLAVTGLVSETASDGTQAPGKILSVIGANGAAQIYTATSSLLEIFKAFSPQADRLVYSSLGINFAQFGIVNVNGTGAILLGYADNTDALSGVGIDWSPKAEVVAASLADLVYVYGVPVNISRIYLAPPVANGFDQRKPLTNPQPYSYFFQVNDVFPVFSPDGTRVAYIRWIRNLGSLSADLVSEVHIINVNGTGDVTVMRFPEEQVMDTSWSADGTRLFFDRYQVSPLGFFGNSEGVWSVRTDGSNLVEFLPAPACCTSSRPLTR
jgi:Tol biopolymer transport system component